MPEGSRAEKKRISLFCIVFVTKSPGIFVLDKKSERTRFMEQYEYFKLFHDLGEAEYALLTGKLKTRTFKKGEVMIVPGQVQRELYFVKSGVQMSYFDAGSKAQVIAFTYAPNVCAIPEPFSFQLPSGYFLTCLTDSEMEYISASTTVCPLAGARKAL